MNAIRKTVLRATPLAAILALWGLGLLHLGKASLWYDEILNADLTLSHTWGELLHTLQTEQPYPPLYHLLLKAWVSLLMAQPYAPGLEPRNGLEELLRFPSLVASVVAMAVLTALAHRLRLRSRALPPLLVALHPVTLWYARDARLYAFLILWFLLALLGLTARRRYLWLIAGSATLLTHYFAFFPLVGAVLAEVVLRRRRWPLRWLLLPFVPATLWGLCALPVTGGFQGLTTTGASPSLHIFLEELGPDLLSARSFLLPLFEAPESAWGYGLLIVGVLGLALLTLKDPARGGALLLSFGLGAVGLFMLWQVRPVHHVRYLFWALPLAIIGIVEAPAILLGRLERTRAVWISLALLVILGSLWSASRSLALIGAERTHWYPDFRETVAFLNTHALKGDRGLAAAAYAARVFTPYRSPVPVAAGPQTGERLQPAEGAQLLEAERPDGEGRLWLLLFQDQSVDPGGVLAGTLEAAGGYRVEIWYSRELRLFAYALPEGTALQPLAPERDLEAAYEGGIRLQGLSAHREGRTLTVYLFWELTQPQREVLLGTVHLVRRLEEQPLAQQDKLVLNSYWPLPYLPVGETIPDRYEMILPLDLPEGAYRLLAALYDPQTGERRPVVGGGDMVDLGEIQLP